MSIGKLGKKENWIKFFGLKWLKKYLTNEKHKPIILPPYNPIVKYVGKSQIGS
jgi:hypothetical protein